MATVEERIEERFAALAPLEQQLSLIHI